MARLDAPLILLAGGNSTRFGSPKGLAEVGNELWVHVQCARIRSAIRGPIVVVVGAHRAEYRAALEGNADVTLADNRHPEDGPFSSLKVGLDALMGPWSAGSWLLPIDVPCAHSETLRMLSEAPVTDAVVPEFEGRGGHPVWLSPRLCDAVHRASPTGRLDRLLRAADIRVTRVVVTDSRVRRNLNTLEEWQDYLRWERTG